MPNAKPDNLKLLAGTFRKDRARKQNTPAAGLPPCPKELSDEARKEWRRVARLLAESELLSQLDLGALTSYAVAWARWRKAEHELTSEDLVSISGNGTAFPNPLLKIAKDANAQMLKWAVQLGLTPASRQRLPTVAPRIAGKLSKYINSEKDARRKLLFGEDDEQRKKKSAFSETRASMRYYLFFWRHLKQEPTRCNFCLTRTKISSSNKHWKAALGL